MSDKQTIQQIDAAINTLQEQKRDIQQDEITRLNLKQAEEAMKNRAEIDALVAVYNQQEIEQGQRLARIFRLIKERKGYRRVNFSNGDQWTSWDNPDRLDAGLHIDRMSRTITDITPGD